MKFAVISVTRVNDDDSQVTFAYVAPLGFEVPGEWGEPFHEAMFVSDPDEGDLTEAIAQLGGMTREMKEHP